MKRNILNKLALISSIVFFSACTEKYLDINSNPYQPGDLKYDDYALASALNNLAGGVMSADVNTIQFTDCLLGCALGGYFADSATGWANTISNYDAKDDWTRVFLVSEEVLPVIYSNLSIIKQISEQTNNPVPYAIARIIKVAAMSRITDTYGPIPYSMIGEDGKISIPYDSQEMVYNKFFEELDQSINELADNTSAALMATADYVYGGNVINWIKFANSLKLRLAIRISYANPTKAKEMAEAAINNEFGVIEKNEDNASWKYFGAITNSMYTAVRYNEQDTGGDSHAAADIVCYMNGYKDPRCDAYFEPADFGSYGKYVGLRRGINYITNDYVSKNFIKYSRIKISASDPLVWMNAAEVAFLRAEGAAVFGFEMKGTAEYFYNMGIKLSFEQWGVSGAEDYLMNETLLPSSYTDPINQNSYRNIPTQITIKWDESATTEEKQERIIIQKWIANWRNGNEAWADFRRTGYPKLFPATSDGNRSGGIVDSERSARRMPYPASEHTGNTKNVQEAISKYLNGPDNMATDVWWACKPGV